MWSRSLVLVAILATVLMTALHGWARLVGPMPEPPRPSLAALRPTSIGHPTSIGADDLLSMLPSATVETETAIDLFGNEVDHALAKYRVDRTGGTYEVHSPETEVARLKPPRS